MGQKFRLTPASFPVGLPTSAGTHFFRCSAYLTLCISDYFRHHARFQAFNAPARAGPNADYRREQNIGTNKWNAKLLVSTGQDIHIIAMSLSGKRNI